MMNLHARPTNCDHREEIINFNPTSVTGEGAEGETSETSGRGAMAGKQNSNTSLKDLARKVINAHNGLYIHNTNLMWYMAIRS